MSESPEPAYLTALLNETLGIGLRSRPAPSTPAAGISMPHLGGIAQGTLTGSSGGGVVASDVLFVPSLNLGASAMPEGTLPP
jgi:hypothetical protein